jgi:hypothetical protein
MARNADDHPERVFPEKNCRSRAAGPRRVNSKLPAGTAAGFAVAGTQELGNGEIL